MKESLSQDRLNVGEMWSMMNRENSNWGIEGYEAPRKYIGKHHGGAIKDNFPKKGWKRPNYIDDIDKWSKSFYNKEKADKVKDFLDEHNRDLKEYNAPAYNSKEKAQCKYYKHDRHLYTTQMIQNEKTKYELKDPEKLNVIEELKQKLAEEKKEKDKVPPLKAIIEKYKARGGSLPFLVNKGSAIG